MKKILIEFLFNKKFVFWILVMFLMMFLIYRPIINDKTLYMNVKNITDNSYLVNVFVLPLSFFDMGLFGCIVLDSLYLCILSYLVVSFVDFFFLTYSSVALTRIKRKKWLKYIIKVNILYSLFILLLYVGLFIVLCFQSKIVNSININIIILIIYKILLTIIYPNLYLDFYLKTDNYIYSIFGAILCYVLFEFIIRATYIESIAKLKNSSLIIVFLILFILYLFRKLKINFEGRDI